MSREDIYERLNEVFRDVFDDYSISVNDETTADDIDGWDSLMHITLISEIENEFDFKFQMKGTESQIGINDFIGKKRIFKKSCFTDSLCFLLIAWNLGRHV